MINPFTISNNKRYTLDNKTIVIEEAISKDIAWYYLDEWWKKQIKIPQLHYSTRWWLMMHAQKYKYRK